MAASRCMSSVGPDAAPLSLRCWKISALVARAFFFNVSEVLLEIIGVLLGVTRGVPSGETKRTTQGSLASFTPYARE
eukprot:11970-Pyramimonas_sp.AAC.1